MTAELAPVTDGAPQLALLKAVGLDRLNPDQRALAINIANRYDLDLLLKHLVMIEGRPYITRDGLLHIAHRSGQFDGMETSEPTLADGFWRSTCAVFRKDMGRPFKYTGRYPEKGSNAKFAPEMAVKVGEVMALRRAFDVSAPTMEEGWDTEAVEPIETAKRQSLPEKVAERAAAIKETAAPAAASAPIEAGDPAEPGAEAILAEPVVGSGAETPGEAVTQCLAMSPFDGEELEQCRKEKGHEGTHRSTTATWPQK